MVFAISSPAPTQQSAICLDDARTLCLSCSFGSGERVTCNITFDKVAYDGAFTLNKVKNPDDTDGSICVGNYCAGCNVWKKRKQCWATSLSGYCWVKCDSGQPCTSGCK